MFAHWPALIAPRALSVLIGYTARLRGTSHPPTEKSPDTARQLLLLTLSRQQDDPGHQQPLRRGAGAWKCRGKTTFKVFEFLSYFNVVAAELLNDLLAGTFYHAL